MVRPLSAFTSTDFHASFHNNDNTEFPFYTHSALQNRINRQTHMCATTLVVFLISTLIENLSEPEVILVILITSEKSSRDL